MMMYPGLWLMLFLDANSLSPLLRPPFTSRDEQMENNKAMQNPVRCKLCAHKEASPGHVAL